MKILNMVIPILMHFCSFISNWSVVSRMPSHKMWRRHPTKCDFINDVNNFREYIAGYTVAKYLGYPIRCRVPKASPLEIRLTLCKGTQISFMNKARLQPDKCTCSYKSTLSTLTGPQIRVLTWKLFSYFSTKTYDVGTQKNRLNETVLLSTQNTCLNWWIRK